MDAKPQRLVRAVPAPSHGNENIPPTKQSMHQRHKSVGNLKALSNTGALNAAPKRAVFADVSNTARPYAEVVGKAGLKKAVAAAVTVTSRDTRVDDKENGRADTRPTAASEATIHGSKYLAAAPISSSAVVPAAAKPTVRNNALAPQRQSNTSLAHPLVVKQAVSKKATFVYLDRKEHDSGLRPEVGCSVDDLVAIVDKEIKNPRHYKSQPVLRSEEPILRRTQSKYLNKCEKIIDFDDEDDGNVTEAAYEDAVEQLTQDYDAPAQDDLVEVVSVDQEQFAHFDSDPEHQTNASEYSRALPAPLNMSEAEPEEYWDDDEEQDLYDEQGYTTAHSYRSHGENTTGGATTMVAPKVTDNVAKELAVAKAIVEQNQTEEEIEEEAWDVSMVAEYGEEIFEYMRALEAHMLPNPHYMDIQTEIQWSMRSVLMDWLVQVHHRFSLLPETLFLTVNYIDRFLSVKVVSLGKLQLVGATAIFVAAKYEEINCPSVQEIVYMVNEGYTVEEILKAERFMLSMLQFELGWPGPMSFLRRISKADDYDLETRTLAKYFLEVTIMDERFVGSPPSFLAAGAHCLARLILRKGEWTPGHVHYSGYTMSQLRPLLATILDCCQDGRKHHQAVFDKYAGSKFKRASTFVELEMAKGFTLPSISTLPSLLGTDSFIFDDDEPLEAELNGRSRMIAIEG